MSYIPYGTKYKNAEGEEEVLAPVVTSESKITMAIDHVKKHKLVYAVLVAVGAWIIYKKFIKK